MQKILPAATADDEKKVFPMNDNKNVLTDSALCILALCMPRSMRGYDFPPGLEPLSLREYNKFAQALHRAGVKPEELPRYLANPIGDGQVQSCADYAGLAHARIVRLVETIPDCKRIMDGWNASHSLWTVGRGDPEYPRRLKDKMGWNAPAFLFGVGNKDLLNADSFVAVVGSRRISQERFAEAKHIGERIAKENFHLVSGAARGSDEASMLGALEAMDRQRLVHQGRCDFSSGVLGILPHNLAERSRNERWMYDGIRAGDLTLITSEAPDARFDVGAAFARNDLIHAFGQASIVIECEVDRGGTWGGVTSAVRHGIAKRLLVLDGEANASLLRRCSVPVNEQKLLAAAVYDASKPIAEQIRYAPAPQSIRPSSEETTKVDDSGKTSNTVLPAGNYVVYTDGGCRPNPGTGGWGAVVLRHGKNLPVLELGGGERNTTNNRMELTAALKALSAVKGSRVELVTDSQYLKRAFTDGWLDGWTRNGWTTSAGEPVKNKDLWLALLNAVRETDVKWRWTRGHVGDVWNERCDKLAEREIARIEAGEGLEESPEISSANEPVTDTGMPDAWTVYVVKASGSSGTRPGAVEWKLLSPDGCTQKSRRDEHPNATAPRLTLSAVAQALRGVPDSETVSIVTSLEYVRDALAEGQIERWRQNRWYGSSGKVKNADLWYDIAESLERLKLGLVRAPAPGEYLPAPKEARQTQLEFDWEREPEVLL